MAGTDIGTGPTVLAQRTNNPPPPRSSGIWWAVGIALAVLIASLMLALVRNSALQKRAEDGEQLAKERAEELRQMARQCGLAARATLEKLGEPEEEAAADDDRPEMKPALDAGIDSEKPRAVRW